ncbi:uncharacterized protein MELLADRAFT_35481 [Melampsora larici-populina 98AG31]|uniref:Uncharacterized protein n=1 Tax=Melampsora larici-populina (strain 98AG31 / pathotype 3-4-7) TaxID=747676 RepID=F4RJF0_MELLP|nr:uncharacterized protein MELLADRAFT_35481 [Melampsora larici-populina 98AG31]EGG07507.1 hypothetical protein MELLADRAFT_35481 [Melampsora larici-populina 98AG31]
MPPKRKLKQSDEGNSESADHSKNPAPPTYRISRSRSRNPKDQEPPDLNALPSTSDLPSKKLKASTSKKSQTIKTSTEEHQVSIKLLTQLSDPSFYEQALLLKQKGDRKLLDLDVQLTSDKDKELDSEWALKTKLETVLRWKLLRGKFRPTLPSLVNSNSEDLVASVIDEAVKKLIDCKSVEDALTSGAIETMCKLKGIGPATASAFLSFVRPKLIPFMSDESAEYLQSDIGPVKYTLPYYKNYARSMETKVDQLNEQSKQTGMWDVTLAERTFWTLKVLKIGLDPSEWDKIVEQSDSI